MGARALAEGTAMVIESEQSGEYEIFDGSQDEPEDVGPVLREVFFDMQGDPIPGDVWRKVYPDGRRRIDRSDVLGCGVSTEFVGINHNPNPHGEPWIYETIVHVDGDIVYSEWSVSLEQAKLSHSWAVMRTAIGGAMVWRMAAGYRRVRGWLLRRLS
jgi:hypothetical protein